MNKFAVTIGDAGSAACLIPVIHELRRGGVDIDVFSDPDGQGCATLSKAGIEFTSTLEIQPTGYALLVCGTNAKAQGLQVNATRTAQALGVPVVWVGDFYLSGCDATLLELTPDWLTVIDRPAREMARRVRPNFPIDRMPIVGNPAFDNLAKTIGEKAEIRERVRHQLGLQCKLVVFAASSSSQFNLDEMRDTLDAINDMAGDYRFRWIPRFHPADKNLQQLQECYAAKTNSWQVSANKYAGIDSLELYAAADAVVTQYSTEGVKSSLLTPTLFALLPCMRDYLRRSLGGSWPFFPQIEYGAAAVAWSSQEIKPALGRLLDPEADYRDFMQRQRELYFGSLLDGQATKRLTEFLAPFNS